MTSSRPSISLARTLGLFDVTMLVMGGIVGAGIFMNPAVVAQVVHSPVLILGAWLAGGVVALLGAFIYAELAARRPEVRPIRLHPRGIPPLVAFSAVDAAAGDAERRHGRRRGPFTRTQGAHRMAGRRRRHRATALAALTAINAWACASGFVQKRADGVEIGAIAALVFCGDVRARRRRPAGGAAPRRPDGFRRGHSARPVRATDGRRPALPAPDQAPRARCRGSSSACRA
jgi:APA family basic amino acid/polyamine antiporter